MEYPIYDYSNAGVVNYAVQCDWLTLCSWKFNAYSAMAGHMRQFIQKGWKRARWLQYEGFSLKSGLFYGRGMQDNKEHYILRITGHDAPGMEMHIREQPWSNEFYCSRIDLQKTRSFPDWWVPREVMDRLEDLGRAVSMVQSSTGSTIYIGNRTSGRFCRMYEKNKDGKILRLEIELKKAHARIAWDYILDGTSINDIYSSHLKKLMLPETAWEQDYLPTGAAELDLKQHLLLTNNQRRLNWLHTLTNTLVKMCNDHEIGNQTQWFLQSILDITYKGE